MPTNTVFEEGRHGPEFLDMESAGTRSRDVANITGTDALVGGTVLKADGDNMAAMTAGADVPVAILMDNMTPTAIGVPATVIARDAEANGLKLTWPDGITDAEKTAAEAALTALKIIVRK